MENPKNAQTYVLVAPEKLESLVKTNFMLSKSVLLFEYLCVAKADIPCIFRPEPPVRSLASRPKHLYHAGIND